MINEKTENVNAIGDLATCYRGVFLFEPPYRAQTKKRVK